MSNSQLHLFCNKLHTFLVLPASVLIDRLPQLEQYLSRQGLAKVGWGDYQYYGAEYQPLWLAAKALLIPTSAVVSLQSLDNLTEGIDEGTTVYPIDTNQSLVHAVVEFISRYFDTDTEGQLSLVRQKSCGTGFFKARGTYLIFNTCNHWTAYGRRRAGLKIVPQFNFSSAQVQRSVTRNGYLPITVK